MNMCSVAHQMGFSAHRKLRLEEAVPRSPRSKSNFLPRGATVLEGGRVAPSVPRGASFPRENRTSLPPLCTHPQSFRGGWGKGTWAGPTCSRAAGFGGGRP